MSLKRTMEKQELNPGRAMYITIWAISFALIESSPAMVWEFKIQGAIRVKECYMVQGLISGLASIWLSVKRFGRG